MIKKLCLRLHSMLLKKHFSFRILLKTHVFLAITTLLLGNIACETSKKIEQKKSEERINVRCITTKKEHYKETKTFFGELKYAKSTQLVAQHSGIISKLNFKTGEKVKKGSIVVEYLPNNHQIEMQLAKIDYKKAVNDYRKQKELFAIGAVSKSSLEDLQNQVHTQNKSIQKLYSDNIIRAPFSGIITQIFGKIGEELITGQPIFSIAKKGKIEVVFYVTSKDIDKIKSNQSVYFIMNSKRVSGNVTSKSFLIDNKKRAFKITASFNNDDVVFVGNSILIYLESVDDTTSIWIPNKSLKEFNDKKYVYVAKNGNAILKEVVMGRRNEEKTQVIKGLQENEKLIIAGSEKLENNSLIKIIK